MTSTEQDIAEKLASLGYSLVSQLVADEPEGGSRWTVTIRREGREYSTEYWQGAAYRRWRKTPDACRRAFDSPMHKEFKAGEPVVLALGKLRRTDCLKALTEPIEPRLVAVMACLVFDADGVRHGQSFDDFCGDYGLDTDSRKAEKSFNACRDTWSGLVRLGADLDALSETFRDY